MRILDANVLGALRQFSSVDSGRSQREVDLYDLEVVTPMFGGGVEKAEIDKTKLVRETEIRGALRFWWRATKGAEFEDYKRLFEEESRLWGTTDNPSGVNVSVGFVNQKINIVKCSDVQDGALGYVFFPFAENRRQNQPERSAVKKFSFRLALEYRSESDKIQFETALRAWANFGGIGARTRRGCGALFCRNLAFENIDDLNHWLRELNLANKRGVQEWSIIDSVLLGKECAEKDPEKSRLSAWKQIINLYRNFRQTPGYLARNRKANGDPGRSNWIEPDVLRRITKKYPQIHDPYAREPQNREEAFPRIEFGAPIIFHFKDKGSEPADQTVKPIYEQNSQERMASPVLLRPIVFKDDTVRPCAVFFRTPLPAEVAVNDKGHYKVATKFAYSSGDPNSRLKKYLERSGGSALEAFKLYLKDNGFKQIYGGSDR